jgi:RNA polymerase sigma factor (sigma-70 family)
MSDLFERLREGDPEAQERVDRLVRQFARKLCRGGNLPGLPAIDWEDVAQEACHRLYAVGLSQFSGRGTPRSYLYSIVKTTVIQLARSEGRRQRREQVVAAAGELPESSPDGRLDVRRILAALDPACRELVVRAILQDEGYASIASSLGLAESSVRAKLSRCLRRAREIALGGDGS